MNAAIENALSSKPGVTGFLCADSNGLCLVAKKDLKEKDSGKLVEIYNLAATLLDDESPTIVIETENKEILIKDYNSTVVCVSYTK